MSSDDVRSKACGHHDVMTCSFSFVSWHSLGGF